jgi:hypothetical protein
MRLDANSAGNSMRIKRFNNSRRARAVEAHALLPRIALACEVTHLKQVVSVSASVSGAFAPDAKRDASLTVMVLEWA